MDNREFNELVNMYMANADICVAKLREWCKKGTVGFEVSVSSYLHWLMIVAISYCGI